ncbi:amidohydrolase family protein [Virgibacillus byunsanensis]|uniref:Amidohydrolase family protein n=1 Tax=Virgibacillus byunsanensis TaxID=570945 RepID=A0ABW3LM94_9BACI
MKTLIKSNALIDGANREPIVNGCMLIEDGVIKAVGKEEDFGSLDEVKVEDLTDYYLMPGLINSHTHLSVVPGLGDQLGQLRLPGERNILRSMPNIKKDLASGVTTMRIMGEEHFIDVEIKKAIQEGLIEGPRLLVSGRGIVASNGHGAALTLSDGEEEVRKHVRENLAKGADQIKLFVTGGVSSSGKGLDFCGYTAKEVAAAVEEADRMGTYCAAHAHGGKGVDLCIQEGVRTIEHGALVTEKQVEKMIRRNMWIIGTFSILFHPEGIEKSDFSDPSIKEKVLRARETEAEVFDMVLKSGVNLALGTDSMHGQMSYEAKCLTRFGANNWKTIQAITKHAAEACQVEDLVGTLEVGKLGDFIALEENPLENIEALEKVKEVYKEGRRILK